MLVSKHPEVLELARALPQLRQAGLRAARPQLPPERVHSRDRVVQTERLDEIVAWKNEAARTQLDPVYSSRLALPDGMISGLYKYIVFEPIERSTGKVYDEPCHRILGQQRRLAGERLGGAESLVRAPLLPAGGRQEARVKVLVTGGSGFIGSHVVDRARGARPRARNFDLVDSPYLNGHPFENALGDLRDDDDLRRAVAGCDVGHPPRGDGRRRPGRQGSDAHRAGERPRHARAARGGAAGRRVALRLRQHDLGLRRRDGPEQIDEDTPLPLPKHFYTATKIAGEMYVRSYGELYGLEHTILRFGIPYGPRARPTAVVPAFVAKALGGQPLTIAGDGTQSRRFVYVEDLAAGVVAALQPAGREPRLQPRRRARTSASARSPGRCATSSATCRSSTSKGRAGDLRGGEHLGRARARDELGWEPTTTFADGVRRYVDWVTATADTPSAATASRIDGSAAAVLRQESRRAVGVGVVQQHDVARCRRRVARRAIAAGSSAVASRGPRSTRAAARQPRSRTCASAPRLKTP